MQLYMTAAPEQYRLLSGMSFRLSHLAYQIGTDGHLHRATVSRQMQSGLLALNDAMPPAISDPTALSREILRECMSRGYEGVAADFGGSTTPDRMVFLEEAAKLLHRNSKKLFLSAAYGRRIPTAYVLVNTAISGGTLRTMLVDACNAFGRGRVALDIERLRMDFLTLCIRICLPASSFLMSCAPSILHTNATGARILFFLTTPIPSASNSNSPNPWICAGRFCSAPR